MQLTKHDMHASCSLMCCWCHMRGNQSW